MSSEPGFDNDPVEIVNVNADLGDPPMTLGEKCEKRTAAHRLIRSKYDAGVPLFSPMICFEIWSDSWRTTAHLTKSSW